MSKFKANELDKLKEERESFRKPSIPNNTICEFMITDVSFSENAKKAAELDQRQLSFIHDSFTVRLAITKYLRPAEEGKKAQWIKTIEYNKDNDEVEILEPDLILKSFIVFNEWTLKSQNLKKQKTERTSVIVYATALEQMIGLPFEEAVNLLCKVAEENEIPVTLKDLGITSIKKPVWETIIFCAYKRYLKKKDGTGYTKIELYDKEAPLAPTVEVYDGGIATKLHGMLLELAEQYKKDNGTAEAPF